jgi:hypothetical protein
LRAQAIQTYLEDYLMGNTGHMFGCLMHGDKAGFLRLTRNAVIVAVLQSFVSENFLWVQREAINEFQGCVTRALVPRYLSNANFYNIYNMDAR